MMYDTTNAKMQDSILQCGSTPLALAINSKHLEIVKLLLEKGADANSGDDVSISLCAVDH